MIDSEMRRLLARKRDGEALCAGEWAALIPAFLEGSVDRAQFAALLMAVTLRGLDEAETIALTRAMVDSGETLDYVTRPVIDKHSSGGVGDTTSLIVVPWAAALGLRVAKLAGRALGHTGGTIDKLESIPGMRTGLSVAEFRAQVDTLGCAIAAQSTSLVPADKAIYALRDHTATVPSVGLIAASIVAKKIATGADAILYDVKVGRGAFMRTVADARDLAARIIAVTHAFGRRCRVLITDMEEPLGRCIGDGLEVQEAWQILRNTRSSEERLPRLVRTLVQAMQELGGGTASIDDALTTGQAAAKFEAMIGAQGGDLAAFSRLARASPQRTLRAEQAGFVQRINPVLVGESARMLCERSGPFAGFEFHVQCGTWCEVGSSIVTVYGDVVCDLRSLGIELSTEAFQARPLMLAGLPP